MDQNVRAAAGVMMQATNQDGKERGAWLYLNMDGTIRVGLIGVGTSNQGPAFLAGPVPRNAIGQIHTHPGGDAQPGPGDFQWARDHNAYATVATQTYLYVIPPDWSAYYRIRR